MKCPICGKEGCIEQVITEIKYNGLKITYCYNLCEEHTLSEIKYFLACELMKSYRENFSGGVG